MNSNAVHLLDNFRSEEGGLHLGVVFKFPLGGEQWLVFEWWRVAGAGTVPVPRPFDSKQLTRRRSCQSCFCQHGAACLAVSKRSSNHIDSGLTLTISISYNQGVVIRLQKRGWRLEGRHRGQLVCGAAAAANKAASAGSSAYAPRHHNPQTTGSNFAKLST